MAYLFTVEKFGFGYVKLHLLKRPKIEYDGGEDDIEDDVTLVAHDGVKIKKEFARIYNIGGEIIDSRTLTEVYDEVVNEQGFRFCKNCLRILKIQRRWRILPNLLSDPDSYTERKKDRRR